MSSKPTALATELCPYCGNYFKHLASLFGHKAECQEQYQRAQAESYAASAQAQRQPQMPQVSHTYAPTLQSSSQVPYAYAPTLRSSTTPEASSSERACLISPERPSGNLMEVNDQDQGYDMGDVPNGAQIWKQRLYPDAGKVLGKHETTFGQIHCTWENPQYPEYPFSSREEWSLVEWLETSGISNAQIDSLLQTKWVSLYKNIMMSVC